VSWQFDDGVPNAPIFSPLHYLWFSEYFVVKVPGQSKYTPTSRGQLAEFVPPSRAPTTEARSSDIAQIGTGSHMSLPYFQFDWYAMNVGCESTSVPCQFSIGGYRWNPMTGAQDRVVSQDFIVPACTAPQYCPLTPIAGVGFENLTSIFVQSMSNGQAATWWVDDIHFGWSDNSCTASDGRKGAPLSVARREAIDTAIRRGIWQWTPYGIKRLASRFARRFF
jgi:collagen type III alpha